MPRTFWVVKTKIDHDNVRPDAIIVDRRLLTDMVRGGADLVDFEMFEDQTAAEERAKAVGVINKIVKKLDTLTVPALQNLLAQLDQSE